MLAVCSARAENVSLIWEPSPDSTVVGYNVYYGTASRTYTQMVCAGDATTVTISNLTQGVTYYFAATAYDSWGLESDYSDEAVYTVPSAPVNYRPTLDAIASLNIPENAGPQSVTLTGISSGFPSEAQTLTVTVSSSSPALIPTPQVSYVSPNTTGKLTFTPNQYAAGTATITVTVSDGGPVDNTVTQSFTVTVSDVNQPPTLSPIANIVVDEDCGPKTVLLEGITSGAPNESQVLTVSVSSSNPGLIPVPAVSYISPAATGSLNFTPSPNSSGSATITVTIRDNGIINNTVSRSFTLTVNPVNDPPTLSSLSNISVAQDSMARTVNLAGIGSGASDENQIMTVTAISSNPALIPHPTVDYAAGSSAGSISFKPTPLMSGTATITVTVDDHGSVANVFSRSFVVTVTAANQAPTLGALADIVVSEDCGPQLVTFTGVGSGSPYEAQTLTVTASSSNTGLIPNPSITYSSPGSAGSLTFTPAPDKFGASIITVTVRDSGTSNNVVSRSFTVSVTAVNDAPTLGALSNVSVPQDSATRVVNLTGIGSGPGDDTQALTVTAISSNPALIPNPSVTYSSPSATGSISFRPTPLMSGTATITVTVDDHGSVANLATRSFVVTVTAANQAPTLDSLADLTINEDAGPQLVTLMGIGSGSPYESQVLTVTASSSNTGLIPTPTVIYSSPESAGFLSLSPQADKFGSAVVTVTVRDNGASNNVVSRTFTVTVNAVNDAPTINEVANIIVNRGAPVQTVNLTGIGAGAANESQPLTITATSSDPSIASNPSISYTSPATTGKLTFVPGNLLGSAVITVMVSDGQPHNNTKFIAFAVTVNEAPTISDIPHKAVALGSPVPALTFSIGDLESAQDQLTLSASSSNKSLVPDNAIVFGGTGPNRTVSVLPLPGVTGVTTITVSVSDGSATVSDTFQLAVQERPAPPSSIQLLIEGEGAITPVPKALVVGQTYTVTAVPAENHEFAGWSGTTNTTATKITFVASPGTVIKAEFVPSPFVPSKGLYTGLFFEEAEVRQETSGFVSLQMTKRGKYTGYVQLGSRRYGFSGQFGLDCKSTVSVARPGLAALNLDLLLGTGEFADTLSGNIAEPGAWSSVVQGNRATYKALSNPATPEKYTIIIPGQTEQAELPSGHSYGTIKVSASGIATISLNLADGTVLNRTTSLSRFGNLPLYVPLYASRGSLVSWINLKPNGTDDVAADVQWIRPANLSGNAAFVQGFSYRSQLVGSLYQKPTGTYGPLGESDRVISFSFSSGEFSNTIQLSQGVSVRNLGPGKMAMEFVPGSGIFRGTVKDPVSGSQYKFGGCVLQKYSMGCGFFMDGADGGPVTLY